MKLIEIKEWLHYGCFISEQIHPNLLKYHVFQNTKEQKTIGTCNTLKEAKDLAKSNKVSKKDQHQNFNFNFN